MGKKIISNALSQGLGDKINSGINPDNISVKLDNGVWQLVFIMNETTTVSYPYENKDDLENDFKLVTDVLHYLV